MKYYVCYPVTYDCNLRCHYCFHVERFESNYTDHRQKVTVPMYIRWRDKFISDATEIVVNFHGGETFLDNNSNIMKSFMRQTTMEKAELLTNGLCSESNYDKMDEFKDRVYRIGFTYHRRIIDGVPSYRERFKKNVLRLKDKGYQVYIKELLFTDIRDEIIEARKVWRDKYDVQVKIQDFKGYSRGKSQEEFHNYTALDHLYIDSEYRKPGDGCACLWGYKNVLIRGGWHEGDIIACFEDPKVVGSIQEMWYDPNYKVKKNYKEKRIDVQGLKKVIYRGTYERDMFKPGVKQEEENDSLLCNRTDDE